MAHQNKKHSASAECLFRFKAFFFTFSDVHFLRSFLNEKAKKEKVVVLPRETILDYNVLKLFR